MAERSSGPVFRVGWIRVTIDLSATRGIVTFRALPNDVVQVEVNVRELKDFGSLDPALKVYKVR